MDLFVPLKCTESVQACYHKIEIIGGAKLFNTDWQGIITIKDFKSPSLQWNNKIKSCPF